MYCLIVIAHPLSDSLCAAMAKRAIKSLQSPNHRVVVEDLYALEFEAAMYPAERQSYYNGPYDSQLVEDRVEHLVNAEALVLVFPTWWFGFPAILKGWFDRVWAPGVAYDHASDFGPIKPRLTKMKRVFAITSLGAPWWVDKLILRQPVKRVLKTAIVGACTKHCRFQMATLYKSETLTDQRVAAFGERIESILAGW